LLDRQVNFSDRKMVEIKIQHPLNAQEGPELTVQQALSATIL